MELPQRYADCLNILEQHAQCIDILYHYTSWEGLKGILNTQQLWLSHHKHLNDTSEVKYAIKTIRNHILSIPKKYNLKLFWEDIFVDLDNIFSQFFDFFICSFCARCNYLYAWRAYANDGAGFSIGFKKDFFIGNSIKEKVDLNMPTFGRTKTYYKIDEIISILNDLMAVVEHDLRGLLNNSAEANNKRIEIAKCFVATLLPLLVSIKHEAYEEEHEYRICNMREKSDCNQKFFTSGENLMSPHFLSKERVYFAFDLENISEIWVGPRLNFEHARHDIKVILETLKFNGKNVEHIKILPSEIPYKNL